ncbi:unnamed protein product [Ambrosiozyma monospora]|uniref:Unnamed protein product n=1 Tax=Ambrosiozyma monospora TaxID=43982 RepID=A0ACB5U8Z6_AMBMO|nr:unnamed protein product [Ambrosiozyma monospora]
MFKVDYDLSIKKNYQTFMSHFIPMFNQFQTQHILQKCKFRNETLETSSRSEEHDLKDFVLPKRALFRALFKTFWYQYTKTIIQSCLRAASSSISPLLLKKLTEFVQAKTLGYNPAIGKGIGYAIGVTAFIIFNDITGNHGTYNAMAVGANAKSVLIRESMRKSFMLSDLGHHNTPECNLIGGQAVLGRQH